MVRRNARRMDLKGKDAHLRMGLKELLSFITKVYMRKCIADLVDDRDQAPRQSLNDFLYVLCVEETQESSQASHQMSKLVANIELYCNLDSAGPQGVPRKGFGPSVGAGQRRASVQPMADQFLGENIVHVANTVQRIVLFGRFLGVDTGGYEDAIPLEGLNVFLGLLLRVRKGVTPLLPPDGEKVMVST